MGLPVAAQEDGRTAPSAAAGLIGDYPDSGSGSEDDAPPPVFDFSSIPAQPSLQDVLKEIPQQPSLEEALGTTIPPGVQQVHLSDRPGTPELPL